MPFEFKCRNCGKIIKNAISKPGEDTLCKSCGAFNNIPEPTDDPNDIPTGGIPSDPRLLEVAAAPEKRIFLGPRSITELIGETYRLFYFNALPVIISSVIFIALVLTFSRLFPENLLNSVPSGILWIMAYFSIIIVFGSIFVSLTAGGIVYTVMKYYIREKPKLINVIAISLRKGWRLIPVVLITHAVINTIGYTIVGIPISTYIAIVWMTAFPAAFIESTGIIGAFRKSNRLAKGSRWRIFGAGILLSLPYMLAYLWEYFSNYYVSKELLMLIFFPVTFIFITVVYFDLRTRKEGYNFEMLKEDTRKLETEAGIALGH